VESLVPPLPHNFPDGDGRLPLVFWLQCHCIRLEYELVFIVQIPLYSLAPVFLNKMKGNSKENFLGILEAPNPLKSLIK